MAASTAITDSSTMPRRNLRHLLRYPSMLIASVIMPALMLLLFGYVFGDALGSGLGAGADRSDYLDYLTPGMIVLTVALGSMGTAVAVNTDTTQGIIARFRTMPVHRTAVLTGHVVASLLQTLVSVALVIVVALVMGFRPDASLAQWLGVLALLAGLTYALTWLAVGFGLVARNPEAASNLPMPLMFLPFLGSALVPPETMPAGVRWFAEYQPFTPAIETLRGLLAGGGAADRDLVLTIVWTSLILLLGVLWSRALFRQEPGR